MELIDLVKLTLKPNVPPPEGLNLDKWDVIPKKEQVYEAFRDMSLNDIKVVMMGQDPYPIPGIATGLPFGIEENNETLPPSLDIIFNELIFNYSEDITLSTIPSDSKMYFDKTLKHWKKEGVLLLNAGLTCKNYKPEGFDLLKVEGSHSNYWRVVLMEDLMINLNEALANKAVFVFMGQKAKYYSKFIKDCPVITTHHPVADHRSGFELFKGSGVFKEVNKQLKQLEIQPVKWLVNER